MDPHKDQTMENQKFTNALINETSPYLLQHAHNPVNWFPWSQDAFDKAAGENKLVIVSLGYSTCHWCHVMERESFMDEVIAEYMNSNFVNIKVDREERPDADAEYMNFVQALTGNGGWPLNVIVLPDKKPVYGGTYFPPDRWMEMLKYLISIKESNPSLLYSQAEDIVSSLKNEMPAPGKQSGGKITWDGIKQFTNSILASSDKINGGLTGAPKFPMPLVFDYLLHYHYHTNHDLVGNILKSTLTAMASGGIYDHPAGGFFRYSTDHKWFLPHFEKMLYDNAQLIELYAKAYQHTGTRMYLDIAKQTAEYLMREFGHPSGGFFSALDADSEGEEGKYYVWTFAELKDIIRSDFEMFCDYYQIERDGNWENGKNILFKTRKPENILLKYNVSLQDLYAKAAYWEASLYESRNSRIRPSQDTKIITSWNALLIKAFVSIYKATGTEKYLDTALKVSHHIQDKMLSSQGQLYRISDGTKTINAFLDDYAFFISALIDLHQVFPQGYHLRLAKSLTENVIKEFTVEMSPLFSYTAKKAEPIISINIETSDNVMPSSNSVMAKNLFFLGIFQEKRDYILKAKDMAETIFPTAMKHPAFFANWGSLFLLFKSTPIEIQISGKEELSARAEMQRKYLPNAVYFHKAGGIGVKKETPLEIILCRNNVCGLPHRSVSSAVSEIAGHSEVSGDH